MAGGCHNYTDSDFNIIFTTKLVVSSLATVTCIAATLLILCAKAYKRFVYRLVLYFMIAVMFQAISLILEQTPIIHNKPDSQVEVRNGWGVPCSIFAFLDQIALWIGNFVVLWIFLYLLHLVWNLYHLKLVQQSQKYPKAKSLLYLQFSYCHSHLTGYHLLQICMAYQDCGVGLKRQRMGVQAIQRLVLCLSLRCFMVHLCSLWCSVLQVCW